ncbi:MAG TPA: hypothetical protein VFY37_11715 [Solirubrobacterales bacterium]|nr:hypothetical protein [Solirubrobacterales bacterium]
MSKEQPMGFMDKFKDAAQQAQDAAKAAGGSVASMGGMGGATGGEPYAATFTQQLIEQSVDGYKQKIGGEIVVNVDPADPKSMLLWG